MDMHAWCVERNLPPPAAGGFPAETLVYIAVCVARQRLPGDVLRFFVWRRDVAEA